MIGQLFSRLFKTYGEQYWWPAESAFEVMIGAILTQNTAWTNVEKAIVLLSAHNSLTPQAILAAESDQLAELIYSSGYHNIKAARLKNLASWYVGAGEMATLEKMDTLLLRQQLLTINGVGPETADSILLYAFNRPIFIVDTYTRRLLSRLATISEDLSYDETQHLIEISLESDTDLFQEFHALIVVHCKTYCFKEPLCKGCPLQRQCYFTSL